MNEEFGGDLVTVTDDEGNEFELEIVDTVELDGAEYTVFVPSNIDEMDPEDPEYGFIILKNIVEKGEELYASVDDEAELNRVYEFYMQTLEAQEAEE